MSGDEALIEFTGVVRNFPSGDGEAAVLKGIDLRILPGEFVAVVGPSGSGKSTLLNILGCLLRPSAGTFRAFGHDVGSLDDDALARLRREHLGFIFQRYQLLGSLSATGNVEMPAVYAGQGSAAREARARMLLAQLGLSSHADHLPHQLSGGQQQRVGIARALMNGGEVILADEPTGALDSQTGGEVIASLVELNRLGHTVILVTHDMTIAHCARRLVEIHDGRIVRDVPLPGSGNAAASSAPEARVSVVPQGAALAAWPRLGESLRMALRAMNAHRLRSSLTMLGMIIGIASVVTVDTLGQGTRDKVVSDIKRIGSNLIKISPGKALGESDRAPVKSLLPSDADALGEQFFVDAATPEVGNSLLLRYRDRQATVQVNGVGAQFLDVRPYTLARGTWFQTRDVERRGQVVVIDGGVRDKLFGPDDEALGKIVFVGSLPCVVIGVTSPQQSLFDFAGALNAWIPYSVALGRILGRQYLLTISVRVKDDIAPEAAAQGIENLLLRRHGIKDFNVKNLAFDLNIFENVMRTITLAVSATAAISLLVGGIGIMNIMLVSVSERTREIGIRRAVGARQTDIRDQFLIESALVCLIGGAIGVGAALAVATVASWLWPGFPLHISAGTVAIACSFSIFIGLVFGYMPARNASRLEPCTALSYE